MKHKIISEPFTSIVHAFLKDTPKERITAVYVKAKKAQRSSSGNSLTIPDVGVIRMEMVKVTLWSAYSG